MGLRNFFPGEPNYTPERDPDGDKLACENPDRASGWWRALYK